MNKNDKISIILPCYNAEKHIERCINSVLNQTYRNIEVLVVNDKSDDKSGEICEAISQTDERIRIFHLNERGGI